MTVGESYFEEAERRGLDLDAWIYSTMAWVCGQAGMTSEMRKYVDLVEPKTKVVIGVALAAYMKAGEFESAVRFFNDAKEKGYELDTFAYDSMMQVAAKKGEWRTLISLHEDMTAQRIKAGENVKEYLLMAKKNLS